MKTETWKLIRGARQLITLHHQSGGRRGQELGALGVIVDGSVLLRNDMIEAVGPTRRIENMAGARHAEEIDATGRVVMPAFVDSRACLVKAQASRYDEPGELPRTGAARSVQTHPASRLEARADKLLRMMARHGTATVGASSGYGSDVSGELKILRALHARNGRPLDLVSILSLADAAPGSAEGEGLPETAARRKLAGIAEASCGEGGMPFAAARRCLSAARESGLAVSVEMLPGHEPGLVEMAVELNALSITATSALRSPETELISHSCTFAILLPARFARDGAQGSIRELIDHGGLIALGSGLNPETAATGSMQTVVQLACEVLGLSLAEAISAATINAAWALGVGSRAGSLEHGKQADLLLLNASDYREIPRLAGTNLTHSLIKRGVVLFEEDFPGWPAGVRWNA